jgi:sortase A
LWYLSAGDEIVMQAEWGERRYVAAEVAYFEEQERPLEERLINGRWAGARADERLTLITCWPYYTNTHRLVVVAIPAE